MDDVCAFGHPLTIGADQIRLVEIDPSNGRIIKEEKKLLRRHLNTYLFRTPSTLNTTGMVVSECEHGLAALPVGPNGPVFGIPMLREDGRELPKIGHSWIRSRYVRGNCCVVRDGVIPDDLVTPADGSFEPDPHDRYVLPAP